MTTSTLSNGSTAERQTPWRVMWAWIAVGLTPVGVFVGFILGYVLGLDPNIEDPLTGWDAAWRVIILWLIVVALPIGGMILGWSARRHDEGSALAAIVVNALVFGLLTLMTLGGGLADAFG